MKKAISILVTCIFVAATAFAQEQNENIKRPTLEIHFLLNDFNGAAYIRSHSLTAAFKDHQFATQFNPGLGATYRNGLSPHIDLGCHS